MDYDTNVFINCPFDEDFSPLFEAIIFAVFFCKFKPRCALEINDGGQVRMEKILTIIEQSRIGIHDISRTELNPEGLPRFNMPYELGLFLGAKKFGDAQQRTKHSIIFDSEPYRYQKFLSDIAGHDISIHKTEPDELIRKIRGSLNSYKIVDEQIPSAKFILAKYEKYQIDKPAIAEGLQLDIDDLNYMDLITIIEGWLEFDSQIS